MQLLPSPTTQVFTESRQYECILYTQKLQVIAINRVTWFLCESVH